MKLVTPFALIAIVLFVTVQLDDTPADADLVLVNRADVFTLDPQRQSYIQDFRMSYALFEGLVRWNNHDFSIEPAVASLPTVAEDRLTYRFVLRNGVRWSNGAAVTAHDFVYSWRRLLLPETAADYSNLMFCVEGAEAFWRWRADQLEAFVADPWAAAEADLVKSAGAFARRLGALLDAADRPAAIDLGGEASGLRAALSTLVGAGTDVGAIDAALGSEALRAARARLDAPASRAAEAAWMWGRAEARFDETVGITAEDDTTLVVRLARPTPYFLDLVCFGVCYPVYRPCVEGWDLDDEPFGAAVVSGGWHAIEAPAWEQRAWVGIDPVTGRFDQAHQWARPGRLVCNGPYVLEQWRYKRDMRLRTNPRYHDPDRVKSDEVAILTIEDANTRVFAFESGMIEWSSEVGTEYQADMLAERLAYEERYADEIKFARAGGATIDEAIAALPEPESGERRDIHAFPTFGTDFFSFNCRPTLANGRDNPFHDARVRRAFVLAVDKEAIVERVTRLNEPVVNTLIPPGSIPGYESPRGLIGDVDDARAELAAAGWRDRDRDGLIENPADEPFPTIDLLWTTNTERYKWISLELKAQWERTLGVRVELRGIDSKFYKEDLKQGNFMIARGTWYGDYGDPTTFLDLCRSTDGNNDRGYASAKVDGMLDDAAAEPDPEKRMRILEACEKFLFEEEVPMLVICQRVQVYMYDPTRIRGLSRHPRLTQYVSQMEVIKR